MFEVLVYMFENYFSQHVSPSDSLLEQELSAAGFEQRDIIGAFNWVQHLKSMLASPELYYAHGSAAMRTFTEAELTKIDTESLSFLIFLRQANVVNDMERDLILDRVMALRLPRIRIEEMRWVTMMALWNKGREKDYLFVEDALYNPRGLTLH